MIFEQTQKVLFRHCDPAGIVFFPRYFEMINDCIELFFDEALGHPFETLHQTGSVPTAQIETQFVRPSRHGDTLVLQVGLTRLGTSSASYQMTAQCGDELRFKTAATLVNVDGSGKPTPWNDALRAGLSKYEGAPDGA